MKRFLIRLALFVTVFPGLLFLVFWDVYYHLPVVFLVVLASVVGASEMSRILEVCGFPTNRFFTPILGALFPILAYLEIWKVLTTAQSLTLIALMVLLLFSRYVFAQRTVSIQNIILKVTGNLSILFYPSFFSYFIVRLTAYRQSSWYLLAFLLITFGNDAMAYVVGNLLGKKGVLKVSPNKSLAGFVGGFAVSPLILLGLAKWKPDLFPDWRGALLFGSLVGLAAILGDLFESALKRSANIKDSGSVIPGRGGMLDSIDSLLFAAPVYFVYLELVGSKF